MNTMPRKLHFVWVGTSTLPEKVRKKIDLFKQKNPEYKVRIWGNEDLEHMQKEEGFFSIYAQQAFKEKKWAFVSDVLRLYALYKEGGWYMDTDVFALQGFDKLLELTGQDYDVIFGRSHEYFIEAGTIGAKPSSKIIKAFIDHYRTRPFIIDDEHSLIENNSIMGVILAEEFGFEFGGNSPFISHDYNYIVLPREAFNGVDLLERPLPRTIYSTTDHRPEVSWVSKTDRHSKRAAIDNFIWSKLGDELYEMFQTKELKEYMERNIANYRREKADGHYRIWL